MERHPRINLNEFPLAEPRVILGSFPTWSLTEADLSKFETEEVKAEVRLANNDIQFFYGSRTNRFWDWYMKYLDPTINRENVTSIKESLKKHQIGITDMILSCDRKGRSALDKHLTRRSYNRNFLNLTTNQQITTKILCTSKGVMNEMLFRDVNSYFPSQIVFDTEGAKRMERLIMERIGGILPPVSQPIFKRIIINGKLILECFALPSPGSPYRRLKDFGCNTKQKNVDFLDSYLSFVFNWFNT